MHQLQSTHIKSTLLSRHQQIAHFFSMRHDGYSTGAAESLNMGFIPQDDPKNTIRNRMKLMDQTNMPFENLTTVNQVHGSKVVTITAQLIGAGRDKKPSAAGDADAMITNLPQVPLMVLTADCVPILLFDPQKKVVAAIHAGWRGTVAKIVGNTIEAMNKQYNCQPSDILAAIGPSIGACCYEVGEEVVKAAEASIPKTTSCFININNRHHFDLWEANRQQLTVNGVAENNIDTLALCTQCHHQHFFSSRADHGITGRLGACIMLC